MLIHAPSLYSGSHRAVGTNAFHMLSILNSDAILFSKIHRAEHPAKQNRNGEIETNQNSKPARLEFSAL